MCSSPCLCADGSAVLCQHSPAVPTVWEGHWRCEKSRWWLRSEEEPGREWAKWATQTPGGQSQQAPLPVTPPMPTVHQTLHYEEIRHIFRPYNASDTMANRESEIYLWINKKMINVYRHCWLAPHLSLVLRCEQWRSQWLEMWSQEWRGFCLVGWWDSGGHHNLLWASLHYITTLETYNKAQSWFYSHWFCLWSRTTQSTYFRYN